MSCWAPIELNFRHAILWWTGNYFLRIRCSEAVAGCCRSSARQITNWRPSSLSATPLQKMQPHHPQLAAAAAAAVETAGKSTLLVYSTDTDRDHPALHRFSLALRSRLCIDEHFPTSYQNLPVFRALPFTPCHNRSLFLSHLLHPENTTRRIRSINYWTTGKTFCPHMFFSFHSFVFNLTPHLRNASLDITTPWQKMLKANYKLLFRSRRGLTAISSVLKTCIYKVWSQKRKL